MPALMRRVWPFAAGTVAVFAVVIVYLHWSARARTFPRFDQGSAASWHVYGGDWNLRDGVYTDRANGRGDKLVGGPVKFGNYAVSSDLRFDGEPGDPRYGDAGILLRVLDPGVGVDAHRGYYAALRPDDHMLMIGAMAFHFRELATTPFPHAIRSMHWYRLTFSARDCIFRAHAEDPETREAADLSYVEHDCTPLRGQVGVRSYYTKASWRNLQVMLQP